MKGPTSLLVLSTLSMLSLSSSEALQHEFQALPFASVAPELQSLVPAIPGALIMEIEFHYFNGSDAMTAEPAPGTQEVTTITQNQPTFYAPRQLANATDNNTVYTLLVLDSSTAPQQLLHYLRTDLMIPTATNGTEFLTFTNGTSSFEIPWLAPDPQPGTPSDHDYSAILYKQPSNFTLPAYVHNPLFATVARNFTFTTFLAQTGLKEPVAANWFRSENASGVAPGYLSPTPLSPSAAAAASASASQSAHATSAAGHNAGPQGTVVSLVLGLSLLAGLALV